MEIQTLKAKTRSLTGRQAVRKMRAQGVLPCVLYGGGQDAVNLDVDRHQFELLVHRSKSGEHSIIKIEVEDKPEASTPVLLKAVQHHPLRSDVIHVDFLRIRLDERIETVVPIRLDGTAPGIQEGGVIDFQLRELEVECLALEVPEEVVVSVAELHLGQSLHVSDIVVPANVTVLTDPERAVVAVLAPRAVKETAEGEGEGAEGEEGAAEPEVISERKERDKDKEKD